MDYKYISQLLERYWECQTTLEEEQILRAFFSQEDIPGSLMKYRDLFICETEEVKNDVLGDDFDERILHMIGNEKPVKAKVISLRQRFMPLFKAAAVVAILLTLGNAMQVPLSHKSTDNVNGYEVLKVNSMNVASRDTTSTDSMQRSYLEPTENTDVAPIN